MDGGKQGECFGWWRARTRSGRWWMAAEVVEAAGADARGGHHRWRHARSRMGRRQMAAREEEVAKAVDATREDKVADGGT